MQSTQKKISKIILCVTLIVASLAFALAPSQELPAEQDQVDLSFQVEEVHLAENRLGLGLELSNKSAESLHNIKIDINYPAEFAAENKRIYLPSLAAHTSAYYAWDLEYLAGSLPISPATPLVEALAPQSVEKEIAQNKSFLVVLLSLLVLSLAMFLVRYLWLRNKRKKSFLQSFTVALALVFLLSSFLLPQELQAQEATRTSISEECSYMIQDTKFNFRVDISYDNIAYLSGDDLPLYDLSRSAEEPEATAEELVEQDAPDSETLDVEELPSEPSETSVPESVLAAEENPVATIVAPQEVLIADDFAYTVQAGDSWFGLSERFMLSPEALAAYNELSVEQDLLVGQELLIPNSLEAFAKADELAALQAAQAEQTTTTLAETNEEIIEPSTAATEPTETNLETAENQDTSETTEDTLSTETTSSLATEAPSETPSEASTQPSSEETSTTTTTTSVETTTTATTTPTTTTTATTTTTVSTTAPVTNDLITGLSLRNRVLAPMTSAEYQRYIAIQNWNQANPYSYIGSTDFGYNSYFKPWCTWYAYNARRAINAPVGMNWGHARTWGTRARSQGYTLSSVPTVGSIAWDQNGNHVMFVEAVYADGTILVSEGGYLAKADMLNRREIRPAFYQGRFQFIDK